MHFWCVIAARRKEGTNYAERDKRIRQNFFAKLEMLLNAIPHIFDIKWSFWTNRLRELNSENSQLLKTVKAIMSRKGFLTSCQNLPKSWFAFGKFRHEIFVVWVLKIFSEKSDLFWRNHAFSRCLPTIFMTLEFFLRSCELFSDKWRRENSVIYVFDLIHSRQACLYPVFIINSIYVNWIYSSLVEK